MPALDFSGTDMEIDSIVKITKVFKKLFPTNGTTVHGATLGLGEENLSLTFHQSKVNLNGLSLAKYLIGKNILVPGETSNTYRCHSDWANNLSSIEFGESDSPVVVRKISHKKHSSPLAGGAASAPTARGKSKGKSTGKSSDKAPGKSHDKPRGGASSKAHDDEIEKLKLQIRLAELNLHLLSSK